MYYSQLSLGVKIYFVYGYIIEKDTKDMNDLNVGIKIDMKNSTFSVLPEEYLRKNECLNVTEGTNTHFKEETEIENKATNIFNYKYVNNEVYIEYLFDNYVTRCIYNQDLMYELLDKEYKKNRFPTIEDFKNYIDEKNNVYTAKITKKAYTDFNDMDEYIEYITNKQKLKINNYQITYEDDYTRYILQDSYNNYYVFYVTAPMEYSLMLDTYTLNLPEFIEKYNSGTTNEKVGYNIEKVIEALNCKDYKYIYNKLADEFKTNYFKTYEEFEEYAKETFSIKNEVTYNKYTESENLSTYEITIKDQLKTVTKTIVMKLKDGTDFIMSFNVE